MLDQADENKSMEPDLAEDACCLESPDQPACSPLADPPIACTLSEAELRERRRTLLDTVRRAAVRVIELPAGYAYSFSPASEILLNLCRLIDMERDCCPFLTFTLIVSAGRQPIRLEITGGPQAKAVIADFFGS
jgi:hypothetical protein